MYQPYPILLNFQRKFQGFFAIAKNFLNFQRKFQGFFAIAKNFRKKLKDGGWKDIDAMTSSGKIFDLSRLLLEKINKGAQEARYRYQLDCAEMEEEFRDDEGPAQRKFVETQTELLKAFSIPPPVSVVFCNDDTLEILYPKLRLVQLEKFGFFWRVFDRRETGRTVCFDVELPRQSHMVFPIILE